jgi:hypothetical protein
MSDFGQNSPTIIKNAAPEMKTTLWGCFGRRPRQSDAGIFSKTANGAALMSLAQQMGVGGQRPGGWIQIWFG